MVRLALGCVAASLGIILGSDASAAAFAGNPELGNDYWLNREAATLERLKAERPITNGAKNIILFLGDGMGISTITAARIMAGHALNPDGGEEYQLNMEKLPYAAFSKTYSVNQQTSDSAPTMVAIMSGVKTKDKVLGVGPGVIPDYYTSVTAETKLTNNILHIAKRLGKSAGVVTTTRLTHATPAACYAHTPDRDWEDSADLEKNAKDAFTAKFPDIARQLIEFPASNNLPQIEVALGGGRSKFLPKEPKTGRPKGTRADDRDLIAEWEAKFERAKYVGNKSDLLAVDPAEVDHLLGIFNDDHITYACDRDPTKEPTLVEMTDKALQILKKNPKGYFLMVEGGRIDHGHHAGNPYRALTEAIEFDEAIKFAVEHTDAQETLIIVTADHSHTFTLGGYAQRGNPILGLVRQPQKDGKPGETNVLDLLNKPYTTVAYGNGPGYTGASLNKHKAADGTKEVREGSKFYQHEPEQVAGIERGRPMLTAEIVTNKNYLPESSVPLSSESHGGEDVAIFARGPRAYLIRGVREQNYIFQVMKYAFEP